jgi:uncharacterized coiled-coil protein SlyX
MGTLAFDFSLIRVTGDRTKQQLSELEARLSQGEVHISHIRSLIAKLQRDGHERAAEKARALLQNLMELQKTYEMDLVALRKEPRP